MGKRENKLATVSLLSVVWNAILALVKISVGTVSGSLALVADGIDSTSDVVTSGITLYTSRIITRPPNPRYPYGYGKAETIASKVLSFFIFFAGAQMAYSSVQRLFEGNYSEIYPTVAIYVTVFSIISKFILARINIKVGKKEESSMLKANGLNMQNDIFISLSVLVGLVFTRIFDMPVIDSIAALLVSFWIMKVGFGVFMDSNIDLMDGQNSPEIYNRIFDIIDRVEGVHHPHRVRVRKIGPKIMIAADIEVEGSLSLNEAHNIAHDVEDKLKSEIDNVFDVLIHVEPLGDCKHEKEVGISRAGINNFWD